MNLLLRLYADLMYDLLKASKGKILESTGKVGKAKVEVDPIILEKIQREIQMLLEDFPLYPELQILSDASTLIR